MSIEKFSELNKEQMIFVYRQLLEDYREEHINNDNLQQRIDLSKKLLKQYIGVLDDVADLYFEKVLSILQGEEVK